MRALADMVSGESLLPLQLTVQGPDGRLGGFSVWSLLSTGTDPICEGAALMN